jgi:integrase
LELTDPKLNRAKWDGIDRWWSDGGSRGAGRLVAKVSQSGVTFYFVYFDTCGKRRHLPMGRYAPRGANGGLSLATARSKAAEHSALYRSGVLDLHDNYRRENENQQAKQKAEESARQRAQQIAQTGSLRKLLDGYIRSLESSGKQSFRDVRSSFRRNVYEPFPAVCEQHAGEITTSQLRQIIARVIEAGKGREAAKLRSFLRAAYSMAIRAGTDPTTPADLHTMGIEANPAASLAALSQFNRTRERVLSANELGHYWQRIDTLAHSPKRDVLMLALLLGGQRPTQLLKVRAVDVDLSARTVTLRDGKGARKQPRMHVLPLTDRTCAIFKRLIEAHEKANVATNDSPATLFSADGKHGTHISTISRTVSEISAMMLDTKDARENFELRDIRRTCETMMAALGLQRDVRAQLLSHGLSGVQDRHYDRHQYQIEKQLALKAWEGRLVAIVEGCTAMSVMPATTHTHGRPKDAAIID